MKQRGEITTLMFVKQILFPVWCLCVGQDIGANPSGYVAHIFAVIAKHLRTMKCLYVTII